MYNQQSQAQGNVGSQYQGFQRQYQPVGTVQSFYSQNQNQQQQYGSYPSSESFHTANYRGNQIGHDAGLRGDSFSPTQQQGFGGQGMNQANYGSASYGIRGNQQAWSGNNNVSQQFGFGNPYGGAQAMGATSSFGQGTQAMGATSSYGQGAQAMGATSSYGQGAQAMGATSSYGQGTQAMGAMSSYGQGAQGMGATSSYGQAAYGQGSNPSSESFHTANYRGNQAGHDAGLRGDAFSPTQQQQGGFGMQQQSGFGQGANYGSFAYGVRGNEQAYSGNNNLSQQFGYNNAY